MFRPPPPPLLRLLARRYASTAPPPRPRRRLGLATGGAAIGLAASLAFASKAHSDAAVPPPKQEQAAKSTFGALLRAYVVYSMCSVPSLVDNAPWLLDTLTSVPGLKWATEAFVRVTFFDQFVGGDSAAETLPLLKVLRTQNNTGTLFAYSIEVDEAQATSSMGPSSSLNSPHKAIVQEMLHCIDVAADFEAEMGAKKTGRRTWVAVKMTALLPDASALIRLSSHIIATRTPTPPPLVAFPGNPTSNDLDALYSPKSKGSLSEQDITMLQDLHADLEAICARAAARGVRIIIDAEYSWYEPAIDALSLALMRRFNASQDGPLVYATYQAYLRRTHAHLVHALLDAQKHGYALGAKLVRGAYHPHEIAAHSSNSGLSISPESQPPVWQTKPETDNNYNACASLLLDAVAVDAARRSNLPQGVGVLFGTHNWESCRRILAGLEARGLARMTAEGRLRVDERVSERITFGQLYGMCDDLTQYLANQTESSSPMVIKYVPYGALADVMPYLSRRAIENKSVLGDGGAKNERTRAWKSMLERIFG
ncbi:Proline dehydrogenase [Mycena chlorophos]|uniref:Proline dehydrogenase n=1 Tax=Mycena chlorophos TaxID=658473 RepID=A0A8H6SEU0_MYCCL|nr:Proline dehydrogenase [Mycena chlorophos]